MENSTCAATQSSVSNDYSICEESTYLRSFGEALTDREPNCCVIAAFGSLLKSACFQITELDGHKLLLWGLVRIVKLWTNEQNSMTMYIFRNCDSCAIKNPDHLFQVP
jgi:hypothetical protein